MKALVYHGPGKRSWEEKPKPVIKDSSDAVVRILRTTITHEFNLDEMMKAYDTFGNAAETKALKVILRAD